MNGHVITGSFRFGFQVPEKLENEKKDQEKSRKPSENEERGEQKINSVKKRKQRDESMCDNSEDEEQPGPSCPVTRAQKRKSRKITFCKLLPPLRLHFFLIVNMNVSYIALSQRITSLVYSLVGRDVRDVCIHRFGTTGGNTKKYFYFPASPLKKGEKKDIWTWPMYKFQLPVACGHQEGTLNRGRLARGQ